MKKAIIIIATVIISVSSFGQKFTLNELIKMNSMDWDNFDTYVTKKGYYYSGNEKTSYVQDNGKHMEYEYDGKICKGERYINKTQFTNGLYLISFQTYDKSDYISIKDQLKAAGFKYSNTHNLDESISKNAVELIYYKGNMELDLISALEKNNGGRYANNTFYEISITNRITQ